MTSQKDEFVKLWDVIRYLPGKSIIKSVHLPKVSSLLQFVSEIWTILSSIISIQNLPSNFASLTEGTKAK